MKLFVSLIICSLFLTSSTYATDFIRLAAADDPIAEVSTKVLVEAYKRLGIHLDIVTLPAERALQKSNSGKLDGEVNRIKGIERKYKNLVAIPVPVNHFEGVAFTKNLNIAINGWESLKSLSILIRIGSKFAEAGTKGMSTTGFPSYEKIFTLIASDRYDVCISSRLVGLYNIKKLNLTGIKALEPPLSSFKLYHYLHNKHKDLVPKIRQTLKEMEKEGMIEKIRAQYISEVLK